jgi:glycosyltransferase involved in cell wall biosynthesis
MRLRVTWLIGRACVAVMAFSLLSCRSRFNENTSAISQSDHSQIIKSFDFEAATDRLKIMAKANRPVLIFNDLPMDHVGGIQTILQQLQDYASQNNVNVVLADSAAIVGKSRKNAYLNYVNAPVSDASIEQFIQAMNPQAIHLVTEGKIGFTARKILNRKGIPYTTAYHSNIPEILQSMHVPFFFSKAFVKYFHQQSDGIMVPSPKMSDQLKKMGFSEDQILPWTHGVDLSRFRPMKSAEFNEENQKLSALLRRSANGRPIVGFVGRISPERNIEALMNLNVNALKVFVGDGEELNRLKKLKSTNPRKYDSVQFLGSSLGKDLVEKYNMLDVLMFDATPDTFGLAQIEAAACGVPVAGLNGTVSEVILTEEMGVTADSLEEAIPLALKLDRSKVRNAAEIYDVKTPALMWFANLALIPDRSIHR